MTKNTTDNRLQFLRDGKGSGANDHDGKNKVHRITVLNITSNQLIQN